MKKLAIDYQMCQHYPIVRHNLTYLLLNKSHHKIVAFPLNYEATEAISNSEICCPKLRSRTYFVSRNSAGRDEHNCRDERVKMTFYYFWTDNGHCSLDTHTYTDTHTVRI